MVEVTFVGPKHRDSKESVLFGNRRTRGQLRNVATGTVRWSPSMLKGFFTDRLRYDADTLDGFGVLRAIRKSGDAVLRYADVKALLDRRLLPKRPPGTVIVAWGDVFESRISSAFVMAAIATDRGWVLRRFDLERRQGNLFYHSTKDLFVTRLQPGFELPWSRLVMEPRPGVSKFGMPLPSRKHRLYLDTNRFPCDQIRHRAAGELRWDSAVAKSSLLFRMMQSAMSRENLTTVLAAVDALNITAYTIADLEQLRVAALIPASARKKRLYAMGDILNIPPGWRYAVRYLHFSGGRWRWQHAILNARTSELDAMHRALRRRAA